MYANDSSDINFPQSFLPHKIVEETRGWSLNEIEMSNELLPRNDHITLEEIKDVLFSAKYTSAGPDQIPYIFNMEHVH